MIELLFSVFRIFCRIGTSDMQIECDNADIHWMRQILQATYNHVLFSAHLNLCYQVSQLYIKWTHPSALVLPRHLFTRTSDSYPETFGSCWCWFFFIDISQQKKKRVNGFIMLHLFPKSKRNMERKGWGLCCSHCGSLTDSQTCTRLWCVLSVSYCCTETSKWGGSNDAFNHNNFLWRWTMKRKRAEPRYPTAWHLSQCRGLKITVVVRILMIHIVTFDSF